MEKFTQTDETNEVKTLKAQVDELDKEEISRRIKLLNKEWLDYQSFLSVMETVINTSYAYDSIDDFRKVLIKDHDQSEEVAEAIFDKLDALENELLDDKD